jgi:hypothetical protein
MLARALRKAIASSIRTYFLIFELLMTLANSSKISLERMSRASPSAILKKLPWLSRLEKSGYQNVRV